jgi:hypothetical protein
MINTTLTNTFCLFEYYKSLGEKALAQVHDEALWWAPDEKSNSISVIVKHLHGNMLSRWTDFLTTDGEKSWRNRDGEFEETKSTRQELMEDWEEGWACMFNALKTLTLEDMEKTIYIRNMGQTVEDAIVRQLAHYAYHVGQIVYLARLANTGDWESLTIPRGDSKTYNKERFEKPQSIKHFTEEK